MSDRYTGRHAKPEPFAGPPDARCAGAGTAPCRAAGRVRRDDFWGRVYRDPLTFGQTTLPVAYQGETYEQAWTCAVAPGLTVCGSSAVSCLKVLGSAVSV
ncbi:hypothetical protein [Deinococcus radiophilus]|uniref:hypothetical protein n=1 Tax=Deinococcus radiophilus TaxID=32062 RepID=UPI0036128C7D